jgi:serine protease Do
MQRIRWYGPALALFVTALLVMAVGPRLARQIAWAGTEGRIAGTQQDLKQNETLAQLSGAFRQVAKSVEPSVVHVQVFKKKDERQQSRRRNLPERFRRWFGPSPFGEPPEDEKKNEKNYEKYDVPRLRGNGSGWAYDKEGHVITNHHVVKDADKIRLRFHDGSERDAKVVGADPKTDIAVLKTEGGPLHAAKRSEQPVAKGDLVFAFGSPFHFEFTVSQGIVSAKGRRLDIVAGGRGYENFIQTDAAINPGNSGGPLTNIRGEVVAMNTAIASNTGSYNGIGFAIPMRMINEVVTQILEKGRVERGYLGVYIEELSEKMAKSFGYDGEGVLITKPIENSPAAKAGLQRGDIIVRINGKPVSSPQALRRRVASMPPGTEAEVTVFRDGETRTVSVTLGELPNQPGQAKRQGSAEKESPTPEGAALLRKLGFRDLATVENAELKQLGFQTVEGGVLVKAVRRGSVAASAGIRPRSVITHVLGRPVRSVSAFAEALAGNDVTQKPVRVSYVIKHPASGETLNRFALLKLTEE